MRQDKQSPEDTMLRTALENMRYKSCTPQDIDFLRTRIAGKGPNDPKLAQKRFRNVSIITALNAQKDKINELGCNRFAAENDQALTSFYSIDKWKDPDERKGQKGHGRQKQKPVDPARKKMYCHRIYSRYCGSNLMHRPISTYLPNSLCVWVCQSC
jgi:hypothetical protein